MTAAAAPRPALVVRPMDPTPGPDSELNFVLATAGDAMIERFGGRYCRKDVVRHLVRDIVARSHTEVATMEGDPDTLLGYAIWNDERIVELLYLKKSLSEMRMGRPEPRPIAHDVTVALLGEPTTSRLIRMRRTPSQIWVMREIEASGFVPSIVPEAV